MMVLVKSSETEQITLVKLLIDQLETAMEEMPAGGMCVRYIRIYMYVCINISIYIYIYIYIYI